MFLFPNRLFFELRFTERKKIDLKSEKIILISHSFSTHAGQAEIYKYCICLRSKLQGKYKSSFRLSGVAHVIKICDVYTVQAYIRISLHFVFLFHKLQTQRNGGKQPEK
jgi:hypothetical protein